MRRDTRKHGEREPKRKKRTMTDGRRQRGEGGRERKAGDEGGERERERWEC